MLKHRIERAKATAVDAGGEQEHVDVAGEVVALLPHLAPDNAHGLTSTVRVDQGHGRGVATPSILAPCASMQGHTSEFIGIGGPPPPPLPPPPQSPWAWAMFCPGAPWRPRPARQ